MGAPPPMRDMGPLLPARVPGSTLFERMARIAARAWAPPAREFEHFMDAEILWETPAEFDSAFDALMQEEPMTEASYTKPDGSYPGYINVQLGDGEMVVTMRGDPGSISARGQHPVEGAIAQLRVPLADWDQFVAQAQRVRQAGG